MAYVPAFKAIVATSSTNYGKDTSAEVGGIVVAYDTVTTFSRVRDGETVGSYTAEVRDGEYAFYLKTPNATSGIRIPLDGALPNAEACVSIWIKPVGVTVLPAFKLALGITTPSASYNATFDEEDGSGWQRYKVAFSAADANGATDAFVLLPASPTGTLEAWLECFQIEGGTGPTTYFHGDMGLGHSFRGPAHKSRSTRKRMVKGQLVKGGTIYDIDNCDTIRCEAAIGIGIAPITPLSDERAAGPGTMYYGSKIGERVIQIKLTFVASTVEDLHALRAYVNNIFPPGHLVTLQYTRAGVTQEIEVTHTDGMQFGELIGQASQRATLELTAPDPYFREVGQTSVRLNVNLDSDLTADYHIAKEDGVFQEYDSGPGVAGHALYVGPDKALYFGTSSDGTYAWVKYWSGSAWVVLGRFAGTSRTVNVIKMHPNGKYLVVGGKFTTIAWGGAYASSVSVNNIGYYSFVDDAWHAMSDGLDDSVNDIDFTEDGARMYTAGAFLHSNTTEMRRAAYYNWNAGTWNKCYTGLSAAGYAVVVLGNGKVAFGGAFLAAGSLDSPPTGLAASEIAGDYGSLGRQYKVTALDKQGRETVATAYVSGSGGGSALTWNAVFGAASYNVYASFSNGDAGFLANVTSPAYNHNTAYITDLTFVSPQSNTAIGTGAGPVWVDPFRNVQWTVTTATGTPYIAVYDPTADDWETIGKSGFDATIRTMLLSRDRISLVVGGDFTVADGRSNVNHVARLVGSLFRPLGTGVNGTVYDMAFDGDDVLYVVGDFSQAGGRDISSPVAMWSGYEAGVWLPLDLKTTAVTFYGVGTRYGDLHLAMSGTTVTAGADTAVTFRGTANSFPRIYVTGPGKPIIQNITTGTAIYLDLTLSDYEVLEIDLRTGVKTVRSLVNGDILHRVFPGSDIASFYLAPGENIIVVFFEGATSSTVMRLVDRPSYLSADMG